VLGFNAIPETDNANKITNKRRINPIKPTIFISSSRFFCAKTFTGILIPGAGKAYVGIGQKYICGDAYNVIYYIEGLSTGRGMTMNMERRFRTIERPCQKYIFR
jgi:hypothetical protein